MARAQIEVEINEVKRNCSADIGAGMQTSASEKSAAELVLEVISL
jgi:hypothetical protein